MDDDTPRTSIRADVTLDVLCKLKTIVHAMRQRTPGANQPDAVAYCILQASPEAVAAAWEADAAACDATEAPCGSEAQ